MPVKMTEGAEGSDMIINDGRSELNDEESRKFDPLYTRSEASANPRGPLTIILKFDLTPSGWSGLRKAKNNYKGSPTRPWSTAPPTKSRSMKSFHRAMQRDRTNAVRLGPPSMASLVCLATERGVPAIRIRSTVIVSVFRAQPTHSSMTLRVSPRNLLAVQPELDLTAKRANLRDCPSVTRTLHSTEQCASLLMVQPAQMDSPHKTACASPTSLPGARAVIVDVLTILSALVQSLPRAWHRPLSRAAFASLNNRHRAQWASLGQS